MSCKNFIQNQSGNVLFMILIGIVLFGALSFAVAQMMQGGANTGLSKEKAALYAQEIIDYGGQIKRAVQMVKVSNDCGDTDLSFENNFVSGYEHASGPSDGCKIFNPEGGGLTYVLPSEKWLDTSLSDQDLYGITHFPEGNCVKGVASDGGGDSVTGFCDDSTDHVDILYSVLYIQEDVCKAINKALFGSEDIYSVANHGISQYKFDGNLDRDGFEIADSGGQIDGQRAMCVRSGSASFFPAVDSYHFYQVLVAR